MAATGVVLTVMGFAIRQRLIGQWSLVVDGG